MKFYRNEKSKMICKQWLYCSQNVLTVAGNQFVAVSNSGAPRIGHLADSFQSIPSSVPI